jgi:NAD+ synthase
MNKEYNLDYQHVEKVLIAWIRDRIKEARAEGAVVGLSGGIDSSVTTVLCKKAFPDNVLGIIMPCYSDKKDVQDARNLARTFNIKHRIINLEGPYNDFIEIFNDDKNNNGLQEQLARANIKPRLRMITLYYYAAINNYLVVGTDNWSELKVGYFTKYGDGGIDLTPLGSLVKTEVRELARYLKIPDDIVSKAPSAGLWEGQTDEKEMGVTYEELDRYILTGKADERSKGIIDKLARKNRHKLSSIPIPDRKLFIR